MAGDMEFVLHPKAEIEDRVERLQSRMEGLTGAIIFQAVDMLYFSGTAQEGLVYVPADPEAEAVVMVRKSLDRAREESPLDVSPLKSMKSLKADLAIPEGAKIGLELDVLPFNNYERVKAALPDAEFKDVSEPIRMVRSVKSKFEIRLIRAAARILDAGIGSVPDHLEEGMAEIELAAKLEAEMRALGHSGSLRFRRFNQELPMGHLMAGPSAAYPSFVASPTGGIGPSLLQPQGPGFRKIRKNEPILVDYGGVYNGYIADETRIFSLGPLSKELEEAHAAALEVERGIAESLRPGNSGREIYEISEALGEELGYRDRLGGPVGAKCGFVGHGVGLEIDEYPVLGPVDHEILPNMTVAVEPKMIYPGVGVVGIEDTFLTTDLGPKRLTRLPQEIWRV
ncbi:Xaa-Pro dipeptidase [Methanothrix harundinacea 6Ac]|uniref:Xaa-Pro dipeptidase n=2 Tax=Methanothrix harundinacea TaxID=301375 RepID=G7WPH8_METH6|nr:Xaa-Pro dipeptidase [Methanothrix harundinacea 6Ac]